MRSAFRNIAAVSTILVVVLTTLGRVPAFAQQVGKTDACNQPMAEAVSRVKLAEPTQGLAITSDGCWMFSLVGGNQSGVRVLRRINGSIEQTYSVLIPGNPRGEAVTHDDKILILSSGREIVFLNVDNLIAGKGDPFFGRISDRRVSGGSFTVITSDDRYAFVTHKNTQWISVIDIDKARKTGFGPEAIVGGIPVGGLPQDAVKFSPDGRYLYVLAAELADGPAACDPQNAGGRPETREGGFWVIDVQRAIASAPSPVVASVRTGCWPSREAISPDGNELYVTLSGKGGRIVAYDLRPVRNGAAPSVLGMVPFQSPDAPGWIVTIDGGHIVTNRFPAAPLTVIDPKKIASGRDAIVGTIVGTTPLGSLRTTPDGNTLISHKPESATLEIVDMKRMTLEPVKPQ